MLESLLLQPFLDLFVVVPFNANAHGYLVDLCYAISTGDFFQELRHISIKRPNVSLYLAHKGCLAVAVGDVRVDGNVVHSRPTDHVRQRWRHI